MRIKECIVVEGRSDTVAIQRAVQADTIETGGSAINEDILDQIRLANERRGVIVLTDNLSMLADYIHSVIPS